MNLQFNRILKIHTTFGGETTFSERFDNGDVQGLLFQTSIEIHIKAETSMSNTGFQNLGSKF